MRRRDKCERFDNFRTIRRQSRRDRPAKRMADQMHSLKPERIKSRAECVGQVRQRPVANVFRGTAVPRQVNRINRQ